MSELMQEAPKVREPFIVDNDMKAEWVLNKIRSKRNEQSREIAELERQMAFYQNQIDLITKETDEDMEFFKSMLLPYFMERQESGFTKETKTQIFYKLPSGKIMIKHQNPDFDYKTNQADTIAWLKKNKMKQFIRVKEEVAWKELKETIQISGNGVATADGEMIPGITVTAKDDVFEVEVK